MCAPRTKLSVVAVVLASLWTVLCSSDAAGATGDLVTLKRYGLSFRPPSGWFAPDGGKMVENLRKLDSEKEDLRAFLASHRGSIPIATYSQHDPRGRKGIIPTINVIGRPNPHHTFEAFEAMIAASSASMGAVLRNYAVKTAPAARVIGGRRSVVFAAEYDISTAAGDTYRVVGTTCAIPCGDIFLQISTSEAVPAQHHDLFERFFASFVFEKP